MKTLADFEAGLRWHTGEGLRIAKYGVGFGALIFGIFWMLVWLRPFGGRTANMLISSLVCLVIFLTVALLRVRKLDAEAEAIGLRCPRCRQWLIGNQAADHLRRTGGCVRCGEIVLDR